VSQPSETLLQPTPISKFEPKVLGDYVLYAYDYFFTAESANVDKEAALKEIKVDASKPVE
jgi:hypothetical protein